MDTRVLNFGLSLHLHPFFVISCSKCSVESARLRRLTWAYVAHKYAKYRNLMCWLYICKPYFFQAQNVEQNTVRRDSPHAICVSVERWKSLTLIHGWYPTPVDRPVGGAWNQTVGIHVYCSVILVSGTSFIYFCHCIYCNVKYNKYMFVCLGSKLWEKNIKLFLGARTK